MTDAEHAHAGVFLQQTLGSSPDSQHNPHMRASVQARDENAPCLCACMGVCACVACMYVLI